MHCSSNSVSLSDSRYQHRRRRRGQPCTQREKMASMYTEERAVVSQGVVLVDRCYYDAVAGVGAIYSAAGAKTHVESSITVADCKRQAPWFLDPTTSGWKNFTSSNWLHDTIHKSQVHVDNERDLQWKISRFITRTLRKMCGHVSLSYKLPMK